MVHLPRVPTVRLGIILICGHEIDLSLNEVCEGLPGLSLDIQLHTEAGGEIYQQHVIQRQTEELQYL